MRKLKEQLNENKLGLTLGIFFALLHAIWAILVGFGAGQKLIDLILPLHFIDMMISIATFNIGTAVLLVILAFIGGYIAGWLFAVIWNWVTKRIK